ncbi:hypothetical protein ABT304_29585 [Nocardioides sp. NPDC000445]|uniref:hypothetical protein n=1 Tax=Nocardioides sp. NPDC000445 TaxID=3154257 RepID=UPI00332327CE
MTAEAPPSEAAESRAAQSDTAESDPKEPDTEARGSDQTSEDEETAEQTKDKAADDEAETQEAVNDFRRQARQYLANSANVIDKAEFGGDAVGGNKTITNNYYGSSHRRSISGPMPAPYVTSLVQRFVRTSDHDELVQRLRDNRVLVLCGPKASGRRTGSIGILTDVDQVSRPVHVLNPKIQPDYLAEQLINGAHHLIPDPSINSDDPLRQHHLHAIQDKLQENDGYAIITIDPRAAVEGALTEQHDWRPPAAGDILRAHLDVERLDQSQIQPALDLEETRTYLETQPSPREIVEYARRLADYFHGQATRQDLADYRITAAEDHARRAFADTNGSLREKAFLIALAVLDRLPYPTIAEAGDDLYRTFEKHRSLSIFGTSHSARLDWARAYEADSVDTDHDLDLNTVTAFRNPATWPAVLRHVWLEHPTARDPIRRWLGDLGTTAPRASRVRAALAAGFLASIDFPSIANSLLGQWAGSKQLGQRQVAAWALYAAAEQGAKAKVEEVLKRWAEGGVARRWTVVHTADALADLSDESAISLISEIAEMPTTDRQLERELERAAARLLISPLAGQARNTLVGWSREHGPRRELAHRAFMIAAGEQADGRPTLLNHGASDQQAWAAFITLWRAALNDPGVRDDARDRLTDWVTLAVEEDSLVPELRRLFADLAVSSNERARLDYLLRHLPADAPADARLVADRIRNHLLEQ